MKNGKLIFVLLVIGLCIGEVARVNAAAFWGVSAGGEQIWDAYNQYEGGDFQERRVITEVGTESGPCTEDLPVVLVSTYVREDENDSWSLERENYISAYYNPCLIRVVSIDVYPEPGMPPACTMLLYYVPTPVNLTLIKDSLLWAASGSPTGTIIGDNISIEFTIVADDFKLDYSFTADGILDSLVEYLNGTVVLSLRLISSTDNGAIPGYLFIPVTIALVGALLRQARKRD